jgi:AmiR/NasT family two-component response regulator
MAAELQQSDPGSAIADLQDRIDELLAANAELRAQAEQLRAAMESRAPIEQAKGILVATWHCDPDRAFALLLDMSNHTNVKLRDLALRLVEGASRGELPRH